MSFVVAIDGPAAAGKGTLARRLAGHYGLAYLDTGALYRATARDVLAKGQDPADALLAAAAAAALDPLSLDDPSLRSEANGRGASVVAVHQPVRAALLEFQRRFGASPPPHKDGTPSTGAVLDGRDIGTVVCPDALVKLYITASDEERARRRVLELQAKGGTPDPAAILADLQERDRRDRERAAAPLKPAEDAVSIDTSDLDADAVFAAAVAVIDQARGAIID